MKFFLAGAALGLASASSLLGQSLFDLAPDLAEDDSFPLTWTAGVNVGYDDNATPLTGKEQDTLYLDAYVGASLLNSSPQTTTELYARVGATRYLDSLDTRQVDVDETAPNAGLGLNVTHRLNERLRLVSNNYVRYERQPDFSTGVIGANQIGDYLTWSSDNAVGYRWSERFATYTGVTFSGVEYDEDSVRGDVSSWAVYNQFRYQLTEQTLLTAGLRYQDRDVDSAADTQNLFVTAGVEHRFSPTSVFTLKTGAQIREIDGKSGRETSPYAEAALRSRINESFSVRAYTRYSVEDYNRVIGQSVYDNVNTLRVGVTGNYAVSEALALSAGVNYANLSYEDGVRNGSDAPDADENLLNLFAGFKLRVTENLFLNGSYNYTDFSGDSEARAGGFGPDYDRQRVSLGVSTTF